MDALQRAAADFLSVRRIAVAGVSREGAQAANVIYRRLRDGGYEVVAVNPAADVVEGDPCWPGIGAVPGGVEAVLIATPTAASADVARDCVEAGIRRVWIHRSFGQGSVTPEAVEVCRTAGIPVIDGACPMMFLDPVDLPHRCFRWILGATGKLPKPEGAVRT